MADIQIVTTKSGAELTQHQAVVSERTKAETIRSNFYTALDGPQGNNGLASKYDALSGTDKTNALTALINWNFGAANATVARENALYVAVCLLFVCVGYLAVRVGLGRP